MSCASNDGRSGGQSDERMSSHDSFEVIMSEEGRCLNHQDVSGMRTMSMLKVKRRQRQPTRMRNFD